MCMWPWKRNPKQRARDDPHELYDLSRPVFAFGNSPVTLNDLTTGIQVFGQPGSGKTSGSSAFFLEQFMRMGLGGLICTSKSDDTELYVRLARKFGRSNQLAVFSPDSEWGFNPFEWEYARPSQGAGHTANLVSLFLTLVEATEQKAGNADGQGGEDGAFWIRALEQLMTNAIDLVTLAKGTISLEDLNRVVTSAAQSREAAQTEGWRSGSYCYHLLTECKSRFDRMTPSQQRDFGMTATFFLEELPALSPRTRSIVTTMFSSQAQRLMRGALGDVLSVSGQRTSLPPEFTMEGGIIILDAPLKEWGLVGLMFQTLYRMSWESAVERRDMSNNPRPVFLHMDESSFHINKRDAEFLRSARSMLACTVLLAQDVSSYYDSGMSREAVDSLLANTALKCFHLNGDAVTNEWAAQSIAKNVISRPNVSVSSSDDFDIFNNQVNVTTHSVADYEPGAMPRDFQYLRSGGERWDWIVDAIVFMAGRRWDTTGKNHKRVSFQQRT